MIAETGQIFTGEHLTIAYICMVISYGLRTMPKPTNVWALWAMSFVQFAAMNFAEGKSNLNAAKTPPTSGGDQ